MAKRKFSLRVLIDLNIIDNISSYSELPFLSKSDIASYPVITKCLLVR